MASGRKPARTDYVYIVTSHDGWNHHRPAHRTLKAALATAATGLMQPTMRKTSLHRWEVTSTIPGSPCRSTVTRMPLVN